MCEKKRTRNFMDFFVEENRVAEYRREEISPSGKYKLVMDTFRTCSPDAERRTWSFTRGQVFGMDSDEPIAVVHRNYSSFWHCFAVNQMNGQEYMFCGEDYQGLTRVNLATGEVLHTLPEEAKHGWGWCHAAMVVSPSGRFLAAEGCYWACPYEIRIYDFKDPDVFPPKDLARFELHGEVERWEDEDRVVIKQEWDGVEVDGKFYADTFYVRSGLLPLEKLEELGWWFLPGDQFEALEGHYDEIKYTEDGEEKVSHNWPYMTEREAGVVWSLDELSYVSDHWEELWEKNKEKAADLSALIATLGASDDD